MKRFALLFVLFALSAPSMAWNNGPSIYSNQGKYLGNLNSNRYDQNSVSNPYGRYGSRYSSDSINNPYGRTAAGTRRTRPTIRTAMACGYLVTTTSSLSDLG